MQKYILNNLITGITIETVSNLWIHIDWSHVMIMSKNPDSINFDSDDELDKFVTHYDRCDGVNYYKHYDNPEIVELITYIIKKHNISAMSPSGHRIDSVDEE